MPAACRVQKEGLEPRLLCDQFENFINIRRGVGVRRIGRLVKVAKLYIRAAEDVRTEQFGLAVYIYIYIYTICKSRSQDRAAGELAFIQRDW